jgi:hypothetical protein
VRVTSTSFAYFSTPLPLADTCPACMKCVNEI